MNFYLYPKIDLFERRSFYMSSSKYGRKSMVEMSYGKNTNEEKTNETNTNEPNTNETNTNETNEDEPNTNENETNTNEENTNDINITPSVPEPPPRREGTEVTQLVLNWLQKSPIDQKDKDDLTILILQRRAYGINKYGQSLMTNDGRNGFVDAEQELGDLFQYVRKCIENGRDVRKLQRWLYVLIQMIDDFYP